MKIKAITIEVISFLFILLFVYAGGSKLMDYQKFVVQIGQSAMLTRWAAILGWLIPVLEVGLAVLLIFKRTQKIALYGSLNLMVVFTAYIFVIMNFTPNVPCSCGGILEKMGWTEHFYFNLGFIFLSIIALVLNDFLEQGEDLILETK